MGLLRTVLEVNLGLFQAGKAKSGSTHKDKALLLFVIRDHVGATPLANLAATLKQDLNRIWDGLTKVSLGLALTFINALELMSHLCT
jgi:hypothetical protein